MGTPTLEGSRGDPVVKAHRRVWSRLSEDGSNVTGELVFDFGNAGINLRGELSRPTGSYVVPIEADAIAAADGLSRGALIAVHGHLGSVGREAVCPKPPRVLDPHDAGGHHSPFVRCPAGWLTAEPLPDSDSLEWVTAVEPGIPVQSAAVERFAEDLAAGEPATFLLERVADPRYADTGAQSLGWKVIGRLDVATARPLETIAGDVPMGMPWRPVMGRAPPADTRAILSTAWAGGFASVHIGTDRVMTVWSSSDGSAWKRAVLPRGIQAVTALLPLGDGVAIIANERRFEPVWRFDVWTSTDGRRWRRVARRRLAMPSRFKDRRRLVHGFHSVGGRVIAIESFTTQACCGTRSPSAFLAAQRRNPEPDATFTWSTSNGKSWTRQPTRGARGYPGSHFGHLISQSDDELLVMWQDDRHSISSSRDGARWRRVGSYPPELDPDSPSALARTDGGYVIAGDPLEGGNGMGNVLAVWTGDGHGDWSRVFERFSSSPRAIIADGTVVIVAASTLDPTTFDSDETADLSTVIVSTDSGATWNEDLGWIGVRDTCLGPVVQDRDMAIISFGCPTSGMTTSYALDLGVR